MAEERAYAPAARTLQAGSIIQEIGERARLRSARGPLYICAEHLSVLRVPRCSLLTGLALMEILLDCYSSTGLTSRLQHGRRSELSISPVNAISWSMAETPAAGSITPPFLATARFKTRMPGLISEFIHPDSRAMGSTPEITIFPPALQVAGLRI